MVGKRNTSGDKRQDEHDRHPCDSWNEPLFALLDEIEDYGPSELALTVVRRIVALDPVEAAGLWLAKGSKSELTLSGWAVAEGQHVPDTERKLIEQQARAFPVGAAADQHRVPEEQGSADSVTIVRFPLRHHGHLRGLLVARCCRWLSQEEFAGLQLLAHALGAQVCEHGPSREQRQGQAATGQQHDSNPSATRFTALVAHELRTPLTGLRGNVQLAGMALRKGDTARAEARLQAVIQAVDGITAFVQNLQDMSHLERGIFQIAVTPADLATSVRNAVKRAARLTASERHSIEVKEPEAVVTAHDPVRMEQAFFNLLVNAVQYSIDGGTILVQMETRGDSVVVTVTDPGIGISPDDQLHIFEPYFRGEEAQKVSAKGLGLGLTICRATVERHGGTVNIDRSDTSGTTIAVQLPLNAEPATG